MNVLMDTQVLIWSLTETPRLSSQAINEIGDLSNNQIFVSVVSIWEIRIKQSIGKLEHLPNDFYERV